MIDTSKSIDLHSAATISLEALTVLDPTDNQILVRTMYSGVSVGTEFAVIRGKLDWGPFSVCTGYQATGVV